MNNRKNGGILTYLAMAAAMGSDFPRSNRNEVNIYNVTGNKPEAPIPNGCQWYSFNDGFSCIASSQKVANRKHDKFINK